MSSVNPVFHSLGFGQDHDYNSANMPVQQVYNNRQCGFNCVCCARMLLGNYRIGRKYFVYTQYDQLRQSWYTSWYNACTVYIYKLPCLTSNF